MYFIKFKKTDIYNPNFKKQLLILWYLYVKESRDGTINCSIKDIITYMKFSFSTCKNGTNNIFKESIQDLINKKYIYTNNDLNIAKPNSTLTFYFSKNVNNEYICFNSSSDFVMLNDMEMNKILNYYDNYTINTTLDNIVYIYLLIKSFMNITEQSPAFCFPSIKKLETYSGFHHSTIIKIIEILQNMYLLYIYDLGKYKTVSGEIKQQTLVYTLNPINKQLLKNNIASLKHNKIIWI